MGEIVITIPDPILIESQPSGVGGSIVLSITPPVEIVTTETTTANDIEVLLQPEISIVTSSEPAASDIQLISEAPIMIGVIDQYGNGSAVGNTDKKTGIDAGVFGSMSVTNDYLYVCVQGGDLSSAIWKKTILFQT